MTGAERRAAALGAFAFLAGFFPCLSIAGANAALAGFVLALAAIGAMDGNPFRFRRSPFDGVVAFFMAAWLVSSALGLDPVKSLGKFPSQLRFVPFYLFLWTGERARSSAFKGYLWGAGAAVAHGLLQAAVHSAGFQAPLLFSLRDGRAHGAFHPLTYAEVILPFTLMGAAFLLEADRPREVRLGALWLGVSSLALLCSQSRGPWLGAALGTAVLAACRPRRIRLLVLAVLIGLIGAASTAFRNRVESFSPEREDGSRSHRLILWNNAWRVARHYPVTGVGAGNLKQAVMSRQGERGILPNPRGKDGDAHNQYLQHLAERGVIGLAALLAVFIAPVLWTARLARRGGFSGPRWALWGMLAFFIAYPAVNVTERAFDDAEPSLVFWTLAAASCGISLP